MVSLDGFADKPARLTQFLDAFGTVTGVAASTRGGTVSSPQCRVLSFARTLARYPGFSLQLDLVDRELSSGDVLSGAIANGAGRSVHLLLVDDEGKVQSMDRFLSAVGGERASTRR